MTVSIDALKDKFRNPGPAELELIARYAMLPESGQRERAWFGGSWHRSYASQLSPA